MLVNPTDSTYPKSAPGSISYCKGFEKILRVDAEI